MRAAVDQALARVTGAPRAESPDRIGKHWNRFLHSEAGGRLLVAGMKKIGALYANRPPTEGSPTEPLVETVAHLLLDDELAFNPWAAMAQFVQARTGKDFRPEDRRGKEIEPGDRKAITTAIRKRWSTDERSTDK